ncbi:hypothetical protein Cgig2_005786 [Carnegiea gigantea]|uniref:Uncharacterized protein n=1 Tax=Carnegiea gigantea TaxID=171969 RepID=A0A9Q1JZY2_9CARY|nr:hypothetical protein Cgig2_005786 [Carnegiea gigantea]
MRTYIGRRIPMFLQANRAVEVNEMWRVRQKELELDDRLKGKSRDEGSHVKEEGDRVTSRSRSKRRDSDASCSSSKISYEDRHSRDDYGLKDEEIEKFLHSRVKRGRGSIGSRMDETGPYLPQSSVMQDDNEGQRVVLGAEKPSSWKASEPSEDESDNNEQKRLKKVSSGGSKKKHSRKHKSKEKLRGEKRKEERQKH